MNAAIFEWMQNPLNEKLMILMRGVSGSGKSYRAKELSQGDPSVIYSADYFFGIDPEEYSKNWTREKLGDAHKWCQSRVRFACQNQHKLVIVDNTNTMIHEMMPYFDMAMQYEYRVEIAEPTSEWWLNDIAPYLLDKDNNKKHLHEQAVLLTERNKATHNVPLFAIKSQLDRYHTNVTFDNLVNSYNKHNGII